MIAKERETLALLMLRLKALDVATEAYVWANLAAQVAGYLGASLTAATPGSIFTSEVIAEWLVGLLHDYERGKHGDDGAEKTATHSGSFARNMTPEKPSEDGQ